MRQREPSASRAYSVATEATESDCCNGTSPGKQIQGSLYQSPQAEWSLRDRADYCTVKPSAWLSSVQPCDAKWNILTRWVLESRLAAT